MTGVHKRLILALPILFATPAIAQTAGQTTNVQWVSGGGQSCPVVCKGRGLLAVDSGPYSGNNQPFYVCRTNENNEGLRPGYNLQTTSQASSASTCVVGWAQKAVAGQTYDCLCTPCVGGPTVCHY
jgi:hypothetical protein